MAIGCRSHLLGRAGCSLCSAQRARPLDPLHVPFLGSRAVAGVEQASKISGRLGSLHAVMHGRQLEALFSRIRRALRIDSVAERVLCDRPQTCYNTTTLQHCNTPLSATFGLQSAATVHGGSQKPLIRASAEGSVTRGLHVPESLPSAIFEFDSPSNPIAGHPTVRISRRAPTW